MSDDIVFREDKPTLAIQPYLNNIIQMVKKFPLSMVIAPTGSGKSIGIPGHLASLGYKVIVSVPTVTAAVSLSRSINIFYPKVRAAHVTDYTEEEPADAMVIYATSKYLKNKIMRLYNNGISKSWFFTQIIMLDEYHTGSIDNYLIYALWKYSSEKKNKMPRLLLSSATIQIMKDKSMSVMKILSKRYQIQLSYMNRDYSSVDDQLYKDTAALIYKYNQTDLKGHILVFAPGKNEIHKIINYLQDMKNAEIYPAYSGLTPDEFNRIYENTSKRKIIISTNIVETSITIDNIGLVIDTMLEKIIEKSSSGGKRLVTNYISKASADQRLGRTGRTNNGMCIRMMKQSTYDKLVSFRKMEIERLPIYDSLMELINGGITPDKIIPPTLVPTEELLDSIRLLQSLESIDNNYNITDVGNFAVNIPLSIRNSSSLWYWIQSGYDLYAGVVMICIIDAFDPSYVWIPPNVKNMTDQAYQLKLYDHKQKYLNKFIGKSELETFLNIYNSLMNNKSLYSINMKSHILKFSNNNSLNNKKMNELVKLIKQVIKLLEKMNYIVDYGRERFNYQINVDENIKLLRPILRKTYSDHIYNIRRGKYWVSFVQPETNFIYSLDRSKLNKYEEEVPPKIISLSESEIQRPNKTIRYIKLALDIPEDEIHNTEIVLKPEQKYSIITPAMFRGKVEKRYPVKSVKQMVKKLPDIDVPGILKSDYSLYDPNDSPYIIMNTIVVKHL